MPASYKVTCDHCGADLTTRSNVTDYRLRLSSESKPLCGGGTVTDMWIEPELDKDAYFCGIKCLLGWVKKKFGLIDAPAAPSIKASKSTDILMQ